ncbi:MAG: F0F1 ATP synthase subunit delta [Microgenomates group bacterium]
MQDTLKVTITTAIPLSASQRKTVETGLSQKYSKQKVVITEEVDPQVVGGVRIRIGSLEYDRSVVNKLEQLRNTLTKSE